MGNSGVILAVSDCAVSQQAGETGEWKGARKLFALWCLTSMGAASSCVHPWPQRAPGSREIILLASSGAIALSCVL